jgi:outer membrane lipoprotein SlyB
MEKSFYKLVATVLSFLILVLPGTLSARGKQGEGAKLGITLKDGHYIVGELIAVKPDSLLLLNPAKKDESVNLIGIKSIRITRKSKAGLGVLCGFLAGGLVGGRLLYDSSEHGRGPQAALGAIVGCFGGGIVGFFIGKQAGKDKTIQLEGKSESEVKNALVYLSRKARIRN